MTETDWLDCADPTPMLEVLGDRASPRKLRLFACACCRRVWRLLGDARSRRAVQVAEQFADGQADTGELEVARRGAEAAIVARVLGPGGRPLLAREKPAEPARAAAWDAKVSALLAAQAALHSAGDGGQVSAAAQLAALAAAASASWAVWHGSRHHPEAEAGVLLRRMQSAEDEAAGRERWAQAALVRDLFGNPRRPVAAGAEWLGADGGAAARMAWAVYAERRFGDVPLLADVLEQSGCTAPDVLGHCRSGGEHVRGCWVLDLLLGQR